MKWMLGLILVAGLAAGCSKSLSSAIATSEIYATFAVNGNSSNEVECVAEFRVGGALGTYLELDGDDEVFCSDGTHEIELDKNETFLNTVSYHGTGLTYGVGNTYQVIFRRKSESHTASAVLPQAMTVTAPSGGNHTKGTPLPVTWNAGTSQGVSVTLDWTSGSYAQLVSSSDSDDGSDTLTAEQTETKTSDNTAIKGNIPATVTVKRHTEGTFPSSLPKGGSIDASQSGSTSVTLVD